MISLHIIYTNKLNMNMFPHKVSRLPRSKGGILLSQNSNTKDNGNYKYVEREQIHWTCCYERMT